MAKFKGPGQWRTQADEAQQDRSEVDKILQDATKKPSGKQAKDKSA